MSDKTIVAAIKNKIKPRQQRAPTTGAPSLIEKYAFVKYERKRDKENSYHERFCLGTGVISSIASSGALYIG
jgi:hypothetical protein